MSCCGKNASVAGTIVHGAVGVARAVLKVSRAEDEVAQARRDKCALCTKRIEAPKDFQKVPMLREVVQLGFCGLCKCSIKLKTADRREECPDGLWGKVEVN